jgi:hypothetical protein
MKADKEDNKLTISKARELLAKAKDVFELDDISKKRLYVSSLIDYIEIDGDNIDIHFSFC